MWKRFALDFTTLGEAFDVDRLFFQHWHTAYMDLMAMLEVMIALAIVAAHARLSEYYSEPYEFGLARREFESVLPDQLSNLESDAGLRQDSKDPKSESETERVFYNFKTKNDDDDVVDREDHVTQYLSELLVNTDSEITSLQVNEYDES